MKIHLTCFLSILFILLFKPAYPQDSCQVLKSSISKTYTGGCKNGLAHGKGIAEGIDHYDGQFKKGLPDGKGTYTWATGEVYTGNWKEGKRHGIGKYTYLNNGEDAVNEGQWLDDKYAGPAYNKPIVIIKDGVDRYSFKKNSNQINRVMVGIYQNGIRNSTISDLMITSSSGYDTSIGQIRGYEGITFPVTIKIIYTTMNKLHTSNIYVRFEFEISEPGDWTVEIHN